MDEPIFIFSNVRSHVSDILSIRKVLNMFLVIVLYNFLDFSNNDCYLKEIKVLVILLDTQYEGAELMCFFVMVYIVLYKLHKKFII